MTASQPPARPSAESREPALASAQESLDQPLEAAVLIEAQIETGLGGLFYLINLGLFLKLYGDFTTPAQPGIALPIWDFIALLGRRLVGEKIQSDPAYSLLAQLAGRGASEEPGRDFEPPQVWRLPAEWLAPFSPRGIWRWNVSGGRLRLSHPENFQTLDAPLEADDLTRQLLREVRKCGDPGECELREVAPAREIETESPLERWIGWLAAYVSARMVRALGLSEAGDLSRVLFEHRARVRVTETHLDVFFALDELPIEVRLSGLDRDPGWTPAAGRFVAFHFE
jgi:hypothetical protein